METLCSGRPVLTINCAEFADGGLLTGTSIVNMDPLNYRGVQWTGLPVFNG